MKLVYPKLCQVKYKDITDYSCDYHAIWIKCFAFPFQGQVSSPKPIESKQGSMLPLPFSLHPTFCPTNVEHLKKSFRNAPLATMPQFHSPHPNHSCINGVQPSFPQLPLVTTLGFPTCPNLLTWQLLITMPPIWSIK